jgi:hypothetical protein
VDWFGLAQDRDKWTAFANAAMNLWFPIKCWETIEWLMKSAVFFYISC